MAVEYRPARADEMERFVYASGIGFGDSTADDRIQHSLARTVVRPEYTLCAFEDGAPISQMATLPFVIRWNGLDMRCGGVTAVSTLPSHRRQGHLRELMTRAFAQMKEQQQPLAMLWASMAAIYQRFGYGVAYTQRLYDFDPRHLRFVDEISTPGRLRLVRAAEAQQVVVDAYNRFVEPRSLMICRESEWWVSHILRPWRSDAAPFLIAVYEEDGVPLGYVLYDLQQGSLNPTPGPDQTIQVLDFVWLTAAAHRALVKYLAGHDLVGKIRFFRLPVDDPLFYQAQEPRLLGATDWDGTLVRIVDVQGALEGRSYDGDGRIVFSLEDDLCPWNSGTWELAVEGGSGRLKRSQAEADLGLSPRLLAILASGRLSATTLAHIGLIDGGSPSALAIADRLFHTAYAPLCADGF